MTGQKDLIEKFLNSNRIALVGVSRTANDFTRKLWTEFRNRGFDAIPVHPSQHEIDGIKCYSRVQDIVPTVEGVLILTPKNQIDNVVNDCIAADVRTVWIYGIRGGKDVNPETLKLCRENNIDVVAGFCPYMFLTDTTLFHRIHRFGWKLIGYYPQ
jgi:predicted CoA-binding protein